MTAPGDILQLPDGPVRVISVTPVNSPARWESLEEMRARLKKGIAQETVSYTMVKVERA